MATEKEKIIQDMIEIVGLRGAVLVADYIIARDKKRAGEEITLDSLKQNPMYDHINIDNEFLKAKQWISQKGGRKLTPRFFVNWLNRIEKPLEVKKCNQIQMEAF
jgi:hypothetical protein